MHVELVMQWAASIHLTPWLHVEGHYRNIITSATRSHCRALRARPLKERKAVSREICMFLSFVGAVPVAAMGT